MIEGYRGTAGRRAVASGLFVGALLVGVVGVGQARLSPSLKWRRPFGTGWNSCPAVADLDLDGYMELVVGSTDGHVYYLASTGAGRRRVKLEEQVVSSPAVGDVDGDGSLEVVVGSTNGTLYCLEPDGETKWTFDTGDAITASPVLADLNLDGKLEVLIGSQDHALHCLSGSGEELWKRETDSWVVGTPAVGDLTGDGLPEVVFGSMDYGVYALTGGGKDLWKFPTEGWVQTSPVLADLNRDRTCETVVASDDGNVYCLSSEGRRQWNVKLSEAKHFRASPVVADVQPGGNLEVIAATEEGTVACLSAYGGQLWRSSAAGGCVAAPIVVDLGWGRPGVIVTTATGKLHGLSPYGNNLFSTTLGYQCWSTPLAADLNRNGKLELYLGIRRDQERTEGFFYQYELNVPSRSAPWRCFHGDQARTGDYRNALSYSAALSRGFDYGTAWEPFERAFAAVVPQLKATGAMSVADRLDDTAGNGNGLLDAAERATLDVCFKNESPGTFRRLTVTPAVEGRKVTIYPDAMYLGRVPPGATKRVRFTLAAAADAPGHRCPLTFTARESGVSVALARAQVAVAPYLRPYLQVVRSKVDDSAGTFTSGNGNGRLGTGEETLLYLTILNASNGTARNLRAALEAVDKNLLVIVGGADLDDLRPGATATAKFHVRAAATATSDCVRFRLTLTTTGMPKLTKIAALPLEHVWHDHTPPQLAITAPRDRVVSVTSDRVTIRGYAVDASGIARLTVNGNAVDRAATCPIKGASGAGIGFSFVRHLALGENPIVLTAADPAGNVCTRYVRVIRR